MNYSKTVNLPKTSLAMKANLTQREPQFQKQWDKENFYQKLRECSGEKCILHDGPPYATGNLHIGTGMNKVLKDIIIRYWTIKGYDAPFVPGWDCHGLPIEHKVLKEHGEQVKNLQPSQIRGKCKKYAQKFVKHNRKDFKRLGICGDWDNPYLTFNKSYEAGIIDVFRQMVKHELIYRAKRPVHWCINCQTALAEAELEYEADTSPSIYVKFKLCDSVSDIFGSSVENAYILIWTTTPWTLPANIAIALAAEAEYTAVKVDSEVLIMANELVDTIMKKTDKKEYQLLGSVKGKQLENRLYKHAFLERTSPLVLADYVTLKDGTGCVHTAPGHGREDYFTGKKYNLDIFCPVDENGLFEKEAGVFVGEHIFTANAKIVDLLVENEHMFYSENFSHEYPHCWRCKSPVIFRATPQWFVAMDHKVSGFDNQTLREKALEEANKVIFTPSQGKNRLLDMLEKRPDWCISRQRHWGVPIPSFYCEDCKMPLMNEATLEKVYQLFRKEGADAWFTKNADEILGELAFVNIATQKNLANGHDIFDVWFESGSSHRSVCMERNELDYPAELYLEGTDQHRGWFQQSLLCSVGAWGKAPYRKVLTHGFVVDETGKKLSKSEGNFISVDEICKTHGADIFRLWCSSVDYTNEIKVYHEALKRHSDSYRKFRNTFRFLLGNLHDFIPESQSVPFDQMQEIDQWALSAANAVLEKIDTMYSVFHFHGVFKTIYNFCVVSMSNFYFMVVKDNLYCNGSMEEKRKSTQTAMYHILHMLVKSLAPILVHTCEEVWNLIAHRMDEVESVHLSKMPKINFRDIELENRYEQFFTVRDSIAYEIEKLRAVGEIGNPNMCEVVFSSSDKELTKLLRSFETETLADNLLVSSINIIDGKDQITVKKTDRLKCVRCWNYRDSVGKGEYSDLCSRCSRLVENK